MLHHIRKPIPLTINELRLSEAKRQRRDTC
jgi:hypothetical protein